MKRQVKCSLDSPYCNPGLVLLESMYLARFYTSINHKEPGPCLYTISLVLSAYHKTCIHLDQQYSYVKCKPLCNHLEREAFWFRTISYFLKMFVCVDYPKVNQAGNGCGKNWKNFNFMNPMQMINVPLTAGIPKHINLYLRPQMSRKGSYGLLKALRLRASS